MQAITQADKLQALMQKAVDGGFYDYNSLESIEFIRSTANTVTLKGWVEFVDEDGNTDESTTELTFNYKELIFNHDFAKALWGEKFLEEMEEPWVIRAQQDLWSGGPEYFEFGGTIWQYHLQQAVIADDPIEYMYGAVFGE